MLKRKPIREQGQDLRNFPTYTIPEAAMFLGVPDRTLRTWFGGGAFLKPSGSVGDLPLLSFSDVVEAYAIEVLRSHHGISMLGIKRALAKLPKHTSQERPLLSDNLMVLDRHLLFDHPARGKSKRWIADLSAHEHSEQLVITQFADIFSKRVLRDRSGKVVSIFPWRYWSSDQVSKPVQIDPSVMSGRLVVTGTRIPVEILEARKQRGEAVSAIAEDYGLDTERVEKALQHLDTKAA